MQKCPEDPQ